MLECYFQFYTLCRYPALEVQQTPWPKGSPQIISIEPNRVDVFEGIKKKQNNNKKSLSKPTHHIKYRPSHDIFNLSKYIYMYIIKINSYHDKIMFKS